MSIRKIEIANQCELHQLRPIIKDEWLRLQDTPNVFRFKLNIQKTKILPGKFNFIVELNSERATLRRAPQSASSVTPAFKETAFNFNKVNPQEILFEYKHPCIEALVTCMVNASPLTKFHTLICPDLKDNKPQILTTEAITVALDLLGDFDDENFWIGFNSPGALASVNHLHLHLFYKEGDLMADKINVQHLVHNVFVSNEPSKRYYVNVHDWHLKHESVKSIRKIVAYFCEQNIPHNVVFTYKAMGSRTVVITYIYPRSQVNTVKDYTNINIACCELAGFVNAGCEKTYNEITEEILLENIKNQMGEIPDLDDKIVDLFCDSEASPSFT
ncbi:hypothetical protein HA402_014065 [Bradysia odoriphaga]|nr:hypothetical protein HA402_014065 [Bradysia odoriphaga]